MTGSLDWITDDSWPSDEGWPYPDSDADSDIDLDRTDDEVDLEAGTDDDLVSLHAAGSHLLDDLGPVERKVIVGRYGLDGSEPRSMRELQAELHLPRADLRNALGDGLTKLRGRVAD